MGPDSGQTSLRIDRAIGGDEDSTAWLIERFSPMLRAQARYRLRGALARVCDPEDLVQDVWAILLPRLRDLKARDGEWTPVILKFLTTTLLRRIQHIVRSRVNRLAVSSEDLSEPQAHWSGVVTRLWRRDARDAVHDAIAQLPPDEQDVLVLRGIEQLPNGHVARVMGIPDSTVTRRYQRALAHLRQLLPGSVFDEID